MKTTAVETPSGIEVQYTVGDGVRKYEVRPSMQRWAERHGLSGYDFDEAPWIEVPSVTTVLEVLDKPGLSWWGQGIGVEGALLYAYEGKEVPSPGNGQTVVDWMTENKKTINHVRDKAGDRGQAVHDAFELWATKGTEIDLSIFPEEQVGYAKGLKQFLEDVKPAAIASEVMVGSVEHGFAGRYDIRFRVEEECQVVYKNTPKRGAHYATLKPGVYLGDLKTSKGIYHLKHDRQLEAYELASVECGYEPTDARGVIHVSADGTYEFSRSTATAEDFLAVLEVWKSDQRMKARKRR